MHFSWKLDFSNMHEKLDPSKSDSCSFIHLKLMRYHSTQFFLLTFLVASFGLQRITSLTANYHWEMLLPVSKMQNVLRTQVLFHNTQPMESNKRDASKSGWQGGISINCYTTFLLETGIWVRLSWLWSLLQNNSTCLSQEKNTKSGVLRVEMVEVAERGRARNSCFEQTLILYHQ